MVMVEKEKEEERAWGHNNSGDSSDAGEGIPVLKWSVGISSR